MYYIFVPLLFTISNLGLNAVGKRRDLPVLRGRHTTGSPRTGLRWHSNDRQQRVPISFLHHYDRI